LSHAQGKLKSLKFTHQDYFFIRTRCLPQFYEQLQIIHLSHIFYQVFHETLKLSAGAPGKASY
jgi:hypothetical protein